MRPDSAYRELADVVARRTPPTGRGRPLLVGVSGPVSVGKSTTAAILRDLLAADSVTVDLLCTDCFLYPNSVLAARGITMRKGYPESFDLALMTVCLRHLAEGDVPVEVPVYSHAAYDIVPDGTTRIGAADVVVIEGVNALQRPAIDYLDLSVYVDADEEDVRRWFIDRFIELCAAADAVDAAHAGDTGDTGGPSFYRMFTGMTLEQRRAVAEAAWDGINGPNLEHHILPSRASASYVLRKAADHAVIELARST